MQISELLNTANEMGIHVFPQNGQIQLQMQWPINSLPDPVRQTLAEIKKRQGEILAHFALSSKQPDIPLLLAALKVQGVHIGPDPDDGFKIYVDTKNINNNYITGIILLDKLGQYRDLVPAHLLAEPPPG